MSDGLIDKPKLFVQGMFVTSTSGETADETTMSKIDNIITYGLQAIEHFLEKNDGQTEHSKLEYKRVVADKEVECNPDGVKIVIFVEDIEVPAKLTAFANGNRAEIHIPKSKIDELSEETNIDKLPANEKAAFEMLLNHFLHEMMHMFGAFHSDVGIMSGVIQLFNEENRIDLAILLDDHSARIVSETLIGQVLPDPPVATFVYDEKDRSLKFESSAGFHTVMFLNNSYYTNRFYYSVDMNFECIVPKDSDWDSLLVQFVYGASLFYKKSSIYNNCDYDRIRRR
ncbi:Peptidase_M10 domain-containing protein [Caenorhabditis elegans]|uniref:Peptidase_M10 domain-containing protein n=1 Tax=Caenorhabditis elegans TaxID=6239 RepID=O17396_CAEEL|nr:Peptidase_M10 domain-containing protein [Caenorhabditis elegans]CCD71660.1 Peptidase_M10 domain-containing protein [Caenorhabditis elegans]|eukprot:NP_508462.1 Uncharacterized protein CELE_F52H2.5 [Caenorhabditis elegans]